MLFFGGYGVQAGRESYMIPVDARIWKETDVRREGVSVESVLRSDPAKRAPAPSWSWSTPPGATPMSAASAPISHGLAPIAAPDNALILTSATPGKVADDSKGANSVLMTELLTHIGVSAMPGSPASRASSTRPASPSPAPPTASRCRRCRPRCSTTSASPRPIRRDTAASPSRPANSSTVVPANAGTSYAAAHR